MTRRGAALFIALVVVLLGGLLVVVSTMVAAVEIRVGTAWSEQRQANTAAASAAALAVPAAESRFALLLPGETFPIDDTVSLTRLGDSTALVFVAARSRLGEETVATIARVETDSGGVLRLRVPARSRVRYHPIP